MWMVRYYPYFTVVNSNNDFKLFVLILFLYLGRIWIQFYFGQAQLTGDLYPGFATLVETGLGELTCEWYGIILTVATA